MSGGVTGGPAGAPPRAERHPRLPRTLLPVLGILPALVLALLISRHAVNVPFMDEWDTPGEVLLRHAEGRLGAEDLFRQHNESRKVFPRLVFLGLAAHPPWDVRDGMLLCFLSACGIALALLFLAARTLGPLTQGIAFPFLLATALIFSPIQADNWLWGIQWVVFLPILCLALSLGITRSNLPLFARYLLCGILALIATFSFANGIFLWGLLLPALVFSRALSFKAALGQGKAIVSWCLAFLGVALLYFHDYHAPPHPPAPAGDPAHWLAGAFAFFLGFLGAPLGCGDFKTGLLVGGLVLILFLLLSLAALLLKRKGIGLEPAVAWWVLGAYALLNAAIAATGRLGYGVRHAMAGRYTTTSLYAVVSLLFLGAWVWSVLNRSGRGSRGGLLKGCAAFLLLAFLLLQTQSFLHGARQMGRTHQARIKAKAALLLIPLGIDPEHVKTLLYPDVQILSSRALDLDRLGLVAPPLLKGEGGLFCQGHTASPPPGTVLGTQKQPDGRWLVFGALDPERVGPSAAVVLTTKDAGGFRVVSLADMEEGSGLRPTLQGLGFLRASRWRAWVSGEALEGRGALLVAWSLDTETGKALPLQGTVCPEGCGPLAP